MQYGQCTVEHLDSSRTYATPKMLVLQQLYKISDEELEYQVND
ncbi:hypothetical protein RintRC_3552 [Richelia intracellularis]|nr:hypothetical protein RintRC_3552 [Richelia intracellularis]